MNFGSDRLILSSSKLVDLMKKLVVLGGETVHLTPTEYRLLEAMVTNPGKLLDVVAAESVGAGIQNGVQLSAALCETVAPEVARRPLPRWISTEDSATAGFLKVIPFGRS